MGDASLDFRGLDFAETSRDVLDEGEDVNVRQLANPRFPNAENHLDRIALRRVWRVEDDSAPELLAEPARLVLVDGRVVHDEHDILVVESVQCDEFSHVRLKQRRRDCRIENFAVTLARVTDGTNAAQGHVRS